MIRSLCVVVLASACSSTKPPPPAPVPCIAHFAGDVGDTITATACGASGDAGASTFVAHAVGATVTSFDVSIALTTSSGTFSSETEASDWSATATTGDAGCVFVGGAAAVPSGSYTLVLGDDGHGTLTMSLEVQAPAATDCGPHDVENVELTF